MDHDHPGKGWFVYFRIYGPEQPALDGSWKAGDVEEVAPRLSRRDPDRPQLER
jgi:hypothetical protein